MKVADCIFHHGTIYSADQHNSFFEAIALKAGIIIALGSNETIMSYAVASTQIIDLQGKTLMPGIVDAHMHPFWGGHQLINCSLNYASLTIAQTLAKVQHALNTDPLTGPDDWFQVRAWLRSAMIPTGIDITSHDLDQLQTQRPVVLFSNDCHTLVANSRALKLLGINAHTPEPNDGKIGRFYDGHPNGILEDAPAMRAYDNIPPLSFEQSLTIAALVQRVLNKQGVTTVLDARVHERTLELIGQLKATNQLTLRYYCAKEIMPSDAPTLLDVPQAIANTMEFCQPYRAKSTGPEPGLAIYTVKFFVDGVLHPMRTAALLEPYFVNKGNDDVPNWQPSDHYGDLYFPNKIGPLPFSMGR